MTAIVGLADNGIVYIGGDSAGVSGYSMTVRADSKVFFTGPYLFGFTTSFRMGQLIRYALDAPQPDGDLDRFMATTFIDAVRDCLKAGGWARKDSEREEGGTFLVGVRGRLFTVEDDYQVGASADGYAAVGCGSEIALGALFATARTRMAPTRRIMVALQAAERFSAGVRGPFLCLSTLDTGEDSRAPDTPAPDDRADTPAPDSRAQDAPAPDTSAQDSRAQDTLTPDGRAQNTPAPDISAS